MPSRISAFRYFALAAALALVTTAPSLAGLKIIRIPAGGTGGTPPPNLAGGGNLADVFDVAADYWEMAYPDPNQDWTVEFEFSWDPVLNGDGPLSAQFVLGNVGGDPERVQSGRMNFRNTGTTAWFADPHPRTNSAYGFVEPNGGNAGVPSEPEDIYVNVGITFSNPVNPDAKDHLDLLTIAMHEIGHGLGLLAHPPEWQAPPEIVISEAVSARYAGYSYLYEIGGNEHLGFPSLMSGRNRLDVRQFPSVQDIMTMAQISHYNRPVLSPYMELIIRGLDLPPGQKIALQAKLHKSRALFDAGKHTAAKNLLNAFINQVQANPGGRLNQEQLDGLVSMAQLRMDYIDSAPPGEHDDDTPHLPGPAACGTVSATMLPLTLLGLALIHQSRRRRSNKTSRP